MKIINFQKKNKNKYEIKNSLVDLNFPSIVKKIKQTKDELFLIGYGEYPPQLRCFDLNNLSLKFQRNIDHEIIDFQIISENWEKLALLKSDKSIEFHSKSGYYYQIKIPKLGFSVIFDTQFKILYVASIDGEIFRLNLELGKFSSSIKGNSKYINTSIAKDFSGNLLGLGNSKGMIEMWDLRVPQKPIGIINNLLYLKKKTNNSATYLKFCKTANHKFYSGFSSGEILLYDLRNFIPLISKNFRNNLPIKAIKKNQENDLVLSADSNVIKIWNEMNGKTLNCMKIKNSINHVCLLRKTGLIFISSTNPHVDCKYVPTLGPMPVWLFPSGYYRDENFFIKKKKAVQIQQQENQLT